MTTNYQQRVRIEKAELDVKLTALRAFRSTPEHDALDEAEKDRLYAQVVAMGSYSNILAQRISNFPDDSLPSQPPDSVHNS